MLWESCWNAPWKTNRPKWLMWHPREGRTFTGAYPIIYCTFVLHELLRCMKCYYNSFGYQPLLKMMKLAVSTWTVCNSLYSVTAGCVVAVLIVLGGNQAIVISMFFTNSPPQNSYYLLTLYFLHITWRASEIGADVLVSGWECLLDVRTPCIVIEVVKCLGRANHWRDPEKRKRRAPRWQAAAVISKKVLGIQ